jgi:hypothetical protein
MRQYNVYRTEKGNLTFKVQPELAYTISANGPSAAKRALTQLKKDDKIFNENKEI